MHPVDQRIPYLPTRVEGLARLASNLWWSWSPDARALFAAIDERLWHATRHNPFVLLRQADPARLAACASDSVFLRRYDEVMLEFQRLQSFDGTWFHEHHRDLQDRPIAYFCAEFGLHNSVPIYSGGLGVLAGDHLKSASDLGVPIVAVGLFYRHGYFDQKVNLEGWQVDSAEEYDVEQTPIEPLEDPSGDAWTTVVQTAGRPVHVRAWRMRAGRVPVYLLDTNLEENHPDDRELMSKLYAGGPAMRIRQEWILGVGGVRVLRAVGITPAAWHANEGHAAFMFVERLRELVAAGTPVAEAVSSVRATSVFTTHTPVPAGHDFFPLTQLEAVAGPVWEELGVSREAFLALGSLPNDNDNFHMTAVALRLAGRVNGVSRRHGQVSRSLWKNMWPDRPAETVPIGHVTNGVHLPTWMATSIQNLLSAHLGADWQRRFDGDPSHWDQVLSLDHQRLWIAHRRLKQVLTNHVREDARHRFAGQLKEAAAVVGAGTLLDPDVLTIGFARRFATYKRASLLFRDLDRLRRLCTNPHRPLQIIFAGKAHPEDKPGKEVLQEVYRYTRDPRFEGRIAFLEDYDMHLAHLLVQGVDLWMNLPRVPHEASGTSGMKAALNGVPQLSTLDGWWQEGYDGLGGWAIAPSDEDADAEAGDAERCYRLLEEQVVPLFYTRDSQGIPLGWVERMRHALRLGGRRFTAHRMVQEYVQEYYAPAIRCDHSGDVPPTA